MGKLPVVDINMGKMVESRLRSLLVAEIRTHRPLIVETPGSLGGQLTPSRTLGLASLERRQAVFSDEVAAIVEASPLGVVSTAVAHSLLPRKGVASSGR